MNSESFMECKLSRKFLIAPFIGVLFCPFVEAQEYPANETIISEIIINEEETPTPAGMSMSENSSDTNQQLAEINTKIDEAVEKLLESQSGASSFGDQVDSIKKQNEAIQKLLAERDATLNRINKSLASQVKKTTANSNAISELGEKVDGLVKRKPSKSGADLTAITSKLDGQTKAMEEAGGKLEDQAAAMAKLARKIDGLSAADSSSDLEAVSKKLDKVLKAIDGNDDKLDKLSKASSRRPAAGGNVMKELRSSFTDQSTATDRKLEEVLSSLEAVRKSSDSSLKKKHAAEMGRMKKKIESLEEDVVVREKKIAAIMEKLEKREKMAATRKKRHDKELDGSLGELMEMLDRTKERVDRLHAEASELQHHEHSHGEHDGHGDKNAKSKDAKSKDGKSRKGKSSKAMKDGPKSRGTADSAAKAAAHAAGEQDEKIDLLRIRLEEVKRKLEEARK